MKPADYTFDVDVAEGWTDPGGWRPPDGSAATYQTVRAGLRRETFEWDYAPGQVPEGRTLTPEIPGYQATVPYETGTTINGMIAQAGGDADLWGSTEIMEQVFQQAANRDIPMGVAFALLHRKTAGFTMGVDPTTAANIVTDTLNQLSSSMLRYGNPALAVIDQLYPDVASTLNTVGWLDQNHAAVVGGGFNQFLELAKAFPGGFAAESMYFDQAAAMLNLNAGTSQEMVTVNHEDPLRVKDALRDAFESLLMPVDDAMLDSFAKQFASAESAAHQPLTNAYNRITSEARELWTSLNPAVTPNVGAYSWLFPVAGENHYGNDFGGDRSGHQHGGIDIMANMGTPIVAPVSGKVVSVGTAGPNGTGNAGGNRIHLLGDDGILYYFAHNAYNAVTTGQTVGAGETIGLVGNTGNAWKGGGGAPHLHFEMHANGRFNAQNYNPGEGDGRVNPHAYLEAARAQGATVVSPFDTSKWQGLTIEDAAAAAAYAGTVSVTLPDLAARARQAARDTPLYEDLFGEKPVGLSDVDYASAFAGTAATLAGTPAPEAARIGAATGSMDALYGSLLADSDITDTSTTFRGRLFEMSNAFTDAMAGRP
jgi:murein DD-endopeptidase MepM/ murein hydrolase activator NlpD